MNVKDISVLPDKILGAAWGVQKDRMDSSIYFPLYVVLNSKNYSKEISIYYLSADLQITDMFEPRKPLSEKARRAGWQGYFINLKAVKDRFVRLI